MAYLFAQSVLSGSTKEVINELILCFNNDYCRGNRRIHGEICSIWRGAIIGCDMKR